MKEQFVTYEIAVKLKELGFNEPCLSTYTYDGFRYDVLTYISERTNFNNSHDKYTYSAPLWQQVIDWLRIEHGLFVAMDICFSGRVYSKILQQGDRINSFYGTYEEAREKAILQALELITKKD